jgi:hypothetical protein
MPPPGSLDTPVTVTTTVWANEDVVDPPRGLIYSPNCPQPPCLDCFEPDFGVCLYSSRVVFYQYQIAYRPNGYVNTAGTPFDDFLSVSGQACFVPQSFGEIVTLDWCQAVPCPNSDGPKPLSNRYVIEGEVRILDLNN